MVPMDVSKVISNNLYIIIGAILLACFSAYLTYRNFAKNRYAAASIKFRSSVLEILAGLYPIPTNWPKRGLDIDPVLRNAFPKLQVAVAEFRPYLAWFRRWRFDRAWFIYRLGKEGREIDKQDHLQYIGFASTPNPEKTFKRNVDALLSFAKEI